MLYFAYINHLYYTLSNNQKIVHRPSLSLSLRLTPTNPDQVPANYFRIRFYRFRFSIEETRHEGAGRDESV